MNFSNVLVTYRDRKDFSPHEAASLWACMNPQSNNAHFIAQQHEHEKATSAEIESHYPDEDNYIEVFSHYSIIMKSIELAGLGSVGLISKKDLINLALSRNKDEIQEQLYTPVYEPLFLFNLQNSDYKEKNKLTSLTKKENATGGKHQQWHVAPLHDLIFSITTENNITNIGKLLSMLTNLDSPMPHSKFKSITLSNDKLVLIPSDLSQSSCTITKETLKKQYFNPIKPKLAEVSGK